MRNLLKSIVLLVGALIVFTITIVLGFPLTFIAFFSEINKKSFKRFLLYVWGIINGVFNALAYIIESFAIGYDILANALGGQGLEFVITEERDTLLGSGEYTISAGIGGLKRKNALLPNGKRLDNALNWAFNEEDHAEYALRKNELIEEFENSIPKQR